MSHVFLAPKETEQKKEYTTPSMKVVELKIQAKLMGSSLPSFNGELN